MSDTCKLKFRRLSDECSYAVTQYGIYRDYFGNVWWESNHADDGTFSKVVFKYRKDCLSHLEALENAAATPQERAVEEHGDMAVMNVLLRLVERIHDDVCEIKEMMK